MNFTPSRRFRREYDRIFRKDPAAANVLLLLTELGGNGGTIQFESPDAAAEIARLMGARFQDPRAYQLPGGPEQ